MEQEDEARAMPALDAFLNAHPKSSGAWETAVIRQAYRLMAGPVGEEDLAEVRRLHTHPLPGQEARIRTLMGQYLMELHRPREVVELLHPIMKNEPTMINHFQLGTALASLGEREEALMVLRDGMNSDRGDLQDTQITLLRSKMQALIQDIETKLERQG
jgi:predicted Zn-dependent protease